jgi:hypothetical protein
MDSNFRDLLRNAPTSSGNQNDAPKGLGIKRMVIPSEVRSGVQETAATQEAAVSKNITHEPVAPKKTGSSAKKSDKEEDEVLAIQRVFRSGLTMDDYGKSGKAHQIFIYNKHVNRFLKNFSDDNKDAGGAPIIKNALVEAILDVAIYDMGLEPSGFQHVDEIREFLRSKLK